MTSMIVCVEWNDYGWTRLEIPEETSLDKARKERTLSDSLNFMFRKSVDSDDRVYGHFTSYNTTPAYCGKHEDDMIFFLSFFSSKDKIVGVYGAAEFLPEPKVCQNSEFEQGHQEFNISGDRDLSFGFRKEAYLEIRPEYSDGKKMGPKNFFYITPEATRNILLDVKARYLELIASKKIDETAKDDLEKIERLLKPLPNSLREQQRKYREYVEMLNKLRRRNVISDVERRDYDKKWREQPENRDLLMDELKRKLGDRSAADS